MAKRLRLRTEDEREIGRHATWLELFYDLVFVAAVAQLAIMLEASPSFWGLLICYLLFIPLWWAWVGHTMYADRFDADDTFHRITTLLQMLGAIGMAIFIPWAPDEGANGFAISFVFIRTMLLIQYMRVRSRLPEQRETVHVLLAMIGVGIFLWTLSLKVAAPEKYLIWLLAIVAEMAIPAFKRDTLVNTSASSHHLPERLGLFMIIVLGESIISLANTLTEVVWSLQTIGAAFMAFVLVAMIWWFYFDYVEEFIAGEIAKDGSSSYALYLHIHLFLLFGLVTFAAGLKKTLLHDDGLWSIAVGTSLFILSVAFVRHRLHEPERISSIVPGVVYTIFVHVIAAIHFTALPALSLVTASFAIFFALESRRDRAWIEQRKTKSGGSKSAKSEQTEDRTHV